jgi:hypothetical protein
MKKQTALQWYISELTKIDERSLADVLTVQQQALEMEKQQTIDFADNYVDNCVIPNENMAIPTKMDVPTYYKETYED